MTGSLAIGTVAAASAAAAYVGIAAFRRWAERRQILDHPTHRSSHTIPVPRGAGVVIVLLVTMVAVGLESMNLGPPWLPWYVTGALLVAAVSWLDDLRGVSAAVRFAVHTAAAALIVWSVLGTHGSLPIGRTGWTTWTVAAGLVFWMVWVTNSYNFMDGIDGLAGAQGVTAGLGWTWLAYSAGNGPLAVLAAVLAGSTAGFLAHNWQPARVFLGDVGSAFLGFTFAAWCLTLPTAQAWAAGILIWPFLFDSTYTLVRRLARRENVFAAHRSHIYQRLVACGWRHGSVTSLYACLALCGLVLSLGPIADPRRAVAIVGALALGLVVLVTWQERRSHLRAPRIAPPTPRAPLA